MKNDIKKNAEDVLKEKYPIFIHLNNKFILTILIISIILILLNNNIIFLKGRGSLLQLMVIFSISISLYKFGFIEGYEEK